MEPSRHDLLISCPDRKGLIHDATGVLARHSLNILENHEFVDEQSQTFFMRTEVEGSLDADLLLNELKRTLPQGAQLELHDQKPRRLVVLATKESHCLGDLLLRHSAGELRAELLAVVSQYEALRELTDRFEIPFHCVPVENQERAEHEARLEVVIRSYNPDLLVLAKYMRILSPAFIKNYEKRMINIHHSFLPAFIGSSPYLQAYTRGVKIIGATAHFVTEELDEGPIITQSVIPVNHTQDPKALARSGRDVEKFVLAKAVNLVLENRVIVQGRRTLVFE